MSPRSVFSLRCHVAHSCRADHGGSGYKRHVTDIRTENLLRTPSPRFQTMARPHTPAKAESWVEASRVNSATRGGRTPRPTLGNLEAYVRVRPNPVGNQMSTVTLHDDEANVTVRLASARSGPLGMGRTFSFDRTFGEHTTQDEIFDIVAAPLCDAALDGYAAKQLDGPVCICDLDAPTSILAGTTASTRRYSPTARPGPARPSRCMAERRRAMHAV